MKKQFLLIQILLLVCTIQAQINTTSPLPTSSGGKYITTKVNKGFVPRITTTQREGLKPTADADKGLQVFDTTTNTLWFWNGTSWIERKPIKTSPTNIYDNNGTLTENRVVTQEDNRLSFTATTTNAFNIDGNTFSVDAANGRVGIRTTTPTETLYVDGKVRLKAKAQPKAALTNLLSIDESGVLSSNTINNLAIGASANYSINSFTVNHKDTIAINLPAPKSGHAVIAKFTIFTFCGSDPYPTEVYFKRYASETYSFSHRIKNFESYTTISETPNFFMFYGDECANQDNGYIYGYVYILYDENTNQIKINRDHTNSNDNDGGIYVTSGQATVIRLE